MADPYLPFSIALAIASGIVYGAVGYQVGKRPTSPDDHLAMRMFQAWWFGLAGLSVFTPVVAIMRVFDLDSFGVMMALIQILLIVVFAAIAGLVYYLLYLYTGKKWVLGAVIVYFAIMIVWLEYILLAANIAGWGVPIHCGPEEARTLCPDGTQSNFLTADGEAIETDPLQSLIFGLLVAVPPLLSAVAFFLLYFKTNMLEQKYRIAMISAALVLWFGSSLVGTVTGISSDESTQRAWQLANGTVALCASIAVYIAYKPPAWIRRRLDGGSAPGAT